MNGEKFEKAVSAFEERFALAMAKVVWGILEGILGIVGAALWMAFMLFLLFCVVAIIHIFWSVT